MRRTLAILAAAATAATTLALAAGGGPALAHHTTVTCISPGQWLVENSENLTMTFTSPQGPSGSIGANTPAAGDGTTTVAYSGNALTINGVWSNGVTNSNSGSGQCTVDTTTTTTTTEPTTTTQPTTTTTLPTTTTSTTMATTTTTEPTTTTTGETTTTGPTTTGPTTTTPDTEPPTTPPTTEPTPPGLNVVCGADGQWTMTNVGETAITVYAFGEPIAQLAPGDKATVLAVGEVDETAPGNALLTVVVDATAETFVFSIAFCAAPPPPEDCTTFDPADPTYAERCGALPSTL